MSCHFSVRDVTFIPTAEGLYITVETDIPVHLFLRLTTRQPWVHKKPVLRRGMWLNDDVRFCFTVFEDNEQDEAGDTTMHTFWKTDWPPCTTKWFYFWGQVAAEVCLSTSPIFKYHMPLPAETEEMNILAEYATRSLLSSHSIWATAWGGFSEDILNSRQSPSYELETRLRSVVAYDIYRTFIPFYLPALPAGSTIQEAHLSIYVLSHTAVAVDICITEGLYGEPIKDEDWPLVNPYNTIFGAKQLNTLVDNQHNTIPFNQDGLDWLTYALTRSHQRESFDYGKNAYFLCRDVIWLCQTFTPNQDHQLTAVNLRLKKKTGVPKTYYVDIYNVDTNHHPTGAALATGETDGNTLSTATWGDWRAILLGSGCAVQQGVEYAIVLRSPLSNAANYAEWLVTTAGGYPEGAVYYSLNSGTAWQDDYVAYELNFVEYNHLLKAARRLTLRISADVTNSAPPPGADYKAYFHSPQKGEDYAPFLYIKYKPPL